MASSNSPFAPNGVRFLKTFLLALAGFVALSTVPIHAEALVIPGAATGVIPDGIKPVDGPKAGIPGYMALADTVVHGTLDHRIGDTGSVTFWFHTDRMYQSGTAAPEFQVQPLVEIPGTVAAFLVIEQQSVDLYVGWGKWKQTGAKVNGRTVRQAISFSDQVIRVFMPSLPAGWHHCAIVWNAKTGELNTYLDGTPYNVPGSKVAPWPVKEGSTFDLHVSPFAVAGAGVSPDIITPEALQAMVGDQYRGLLDGVLGVKHPGTLTADFKGKMLYSSPLAQPSDVAGWKMEGVGQVAFKDGWMELNSGEPNDPLKGGFVYWLPGRYPDRFVMSFEFEILNETGLNIIFFAANGQGGRDVFDKTLAPREGLFIQYYSGDIDNYHISYFANMPKEPRRTANLRKNNGFYLMANGPVAFGKGGDGKTHIATLVKDGAHIQMVVDGQILIDFTDDGKRAGPVWGAGRMAWRQMSWTIARYRNLTIRELP